ncbi:hypothetical protein D3C84_1308040 [compost metagenome]
MAVIGRPPVLAVGHQVAEILFKSLIIQLLELFFIVKIFAHRIRFAVMLMQDIKV